MAKSIKTNAAFNFLKTFMSLIFPLITFPYASRILGPDGIGKVNFSGQVTTYFAMFASLGISQYGARQAAKVRDDKNKLSKLVKEIFLINITATLISYAIFFTSLYYIPKFSDYKLILLVCMSKIIFITIGFDWVYTALEEFRYITLRTIFFQIIGIIFLFSTVRTKEDVIFYAIFGVIANVGSNICNFFYTRKYINWSIKIKLEIKKHIKPIFIFFGMSVSIMIYTAMDSVMLGFMTTDSQVGFYSAATKLNKMVLTLLTAMITILLPRLSYYYENKRYEEFNILAQNGLCFIQMLALPVMTGLIILSPSLINIFCGDKYEPSVIPMRIISPVFIIVSTAWMTNQVITATGKEKFSLMSYLTGAAINLTINYLLIPKYGAAGAAIGTLATEFTVTSIQIFITRKYFIKSSIFRNFLQTAITTIIMALFIIPICIVIKNDLLKIVVTSLSGAIIYALCLYLIKNKYFLEAIEIIAKKIK